MGQSCDDLVRYRRYPVNFADDHEPWRLHGNGIPLVLQERRLRRLLLHSLLWTDESQAPKGGGRSCGGGSRGDEDRRPQGGPV